MCFLLLIVSVLFEISNMYSQICLAMIFFFSVWVATCLIGSSEPYLDFFRSIIEIQITWSMLLRRSRLWIISVWSVFWWCFWPITHLGSESDLLDPRSKLDLFFYCGWIGHRFHFLVFTFKVILVLLICLLDLWSDLVFMWEFLSFFLLPVIVVSS